MTEENIVTGAIIRQNKVPPHPRMIEMSGEKDWSIELLMTNHYDFNWAINSSTSLIALILFVEMYSVNSLFSSLRTIG